MTDHENRGFRQMFDGDLSIGLFFPITTSEDAVPAMDDQLELAGLAEDLGFDALWFRDVPLYWPDFGDAGQVYDPWVWLTHIAAHTDHVALATGAIALPVRHPLHVAKSAASVDRLSDGRLVLGVASGDRPPEYPAFGVDEADVPELFRESVRALRTVWSEEYPEVENSFGLMDGSLDVLPKPTTESLPLLVTGYAGQSLEWIAEHGDGWVYYQRDLEGIEDALGEYRGMTDDPYVQVMHVDLDEDPSAEGERIHQGYAAGTNWFRERLRAMDERGVDHVMINVRHGGRNVRDVLRSFGEEVVQEL